MKNNFFKPILKRFTTFMLAVMAVGIMGSSCSENNGNEEDMSFYLTESAIDIPAEATTRTFSVQSNVQWTATSNVSWLTVSPLSGSGNATITVNATANSGTTTRRAIVTVSANSTSHTVNVTQAADTAIPAGPGLCVDGSSSGTSPDGSASNPYKTIQAAVNAASNGDIIKVAKGTYTEAVQIENKKVQLLGGFAGSGNFTIANPQSNVTVIRGTSAAPCIKIQIDALVNSGTLTISGFTIREGQRGIEITDGWSSNTNNIIIKNNTIENNGVQNTSQMGGGIGMCGTNVAIENNVIRNNKAGKGAAIGTVSDLGNFLIADNRIENNTGYSDHGGGVYISNGTGTVTKNIFDTNIIGQDITWGWGGAIVITGYADTMKVVTLSFNIYRNNRAPGRGGAVFVDDQAKVRMEHELLYKNTTGQSGSAIFVDADGAKKPSVLYMNHCTVADNSASSGAALYVQGCNTNVQNSIFWNNGNSFEAVNDLPAVAKLTVNYTLTQQNFTGTGNITSNPLFVNAASGDFHLQSRGGHYNNGQWVNDSSSSPAIDAGNPTSPYSIEPMPNGGRVNLGCYGNTAEASKSN